MSELLSTVAAFALFVLMLPGFATQLVIKFFTTHRKQDPFFFVVYSLIWGLSAYSLYGILLFTSAGLTKLLRIPALVTLPFSFGTVFASDAVPSLSFIEIALSSVIGVCLGAAFVYAMNRGLIYEGMRALGVTKQLGDINIWSQILNDPRAGEGNVWVRVYPQDSHFFYDGWIEKYSDWSGRDELLLRDVLVCDNKTSETIESLGAIYLRIPEAQRVEVVFTAIEADAERMARYNTAHE